MGVMSLGVGKDAEITIYADGSDEATTQFKLSVMSYLKKV